MKILRRSLESAATDQFDVLGRDGAGTDERSRHCTDCGTDAITTVRYIRGQTRDVTIGHRGDQLRR